MMALRMVSKVAAVGLGLVALGVGCGGGSSNGDSKVTVGQSEVKGTVGGVVLEAAPGLLPLTGATVTVIAGGATLAGTTSAEGIFSVKDVPVGSVIVKITAGDHFDVYVTGTLNAAAGNFPASNAVLTVGPVAMINNKGSIAFRVVNEDGAAASGIKVTARSAASYIDFSGGGSAPRGAVDSGGMSGADGIVTLGGLPDFAAIGPLLADQVTINIPPQKLPSPNNYQFLGLTLPINATAYAPNLGQTPTLVLAGPRSPLTVLSSTLDCFEGAPTGGACTAGPVGTQVPAPGPITVAFNQAVNANSVRAYLYNESGSLAQATAMATVNGSLVSIGFSKPLDPGNRYNLAFHANGAYADQTKEYNVTAPFFVAAAMGTGVTLQPQSRIDPNKPDEYILQFSEPIGVGNGSSAPLPCVVYYEADLDGNPQIYSPGEWNSGGNSFLKCEAQFTSAHAGLFLTPDEPRVGALQSPLTGYTTTWRLLVKSACVDAKMYQCSTSGRSVHLVFSRNNDPSSVMKRSNGAPVQDLAPFALPAF